MATDPLLQAILATLERFAPDQAERFPEKIDWEPAARPVGTGKPFSKQKLEGPVPTVPSVPTPEGEVCNAAALDEREERAAILEFDAGMDRHGAELAALDGNWADERW